MKRTRSNKMKRTRSNKMKRTRSNKMKRKKDNGKLSNILKKIKDENEYENKYEYENEYENEDKKNKEENEDEILKMLKKIMEKIESKKEKSYKLPKKRNKQPMQYGFLTPLAPQKYEREPPPAPRKEYEPQPSRKINLPPLKFDDFPSSRNMLLKKHSSILNPNTKINVNKILSDQNDILKDFEKPMSMKYMEPFSAILELE